MRNTAFFWKRYFYCLRFSAFVPYTTKIRFHSFSIHSLFAFLSDFIWNSGRAPVVNFLSSALPVTISITGNTIFFCRLFLSLRLYLVFVKLQMFVPWKHSGSLLIERVKEELRYGKWVTSVNNLKRTVVSCNGRQQLKNSGYIQQI